MENRFTLSTKFILGGALISALLITTSSVFAYDQQNTHPALTDEIVDFYNLNFPDKKLNSQEKQWLIQGAKEEDTGERPLFHFYDPVYNRGIAHFSSKDWALKPSAQANYYNSQLTGFAAISGGDSANDFSYGRALNDYAKGDRERAFIAFGHTLHLLEDAGVPDHTRNDAHPAFIHGQESPYEHEMAKWNPDNFQIARKLFLTREKPVILDDMIGYFDNLAGYSNGNFFSKDTINNQTYTKPNTTELARLFVNGNPRLFIVGKDKNNQIFTLALIDADKDKELKSVLVSKEIGSYILDGYWDRLSKEVVLNGAGALDLFLTEAEKARWEYASQTPEKNWFARLLGLIGIDKLITSDGIATSDVGNEVVDNLNDGDNMVTLGLTSSPLPFVAPSKVTNPSLSPTPLVTKTPVTNVTTPTPYVSPSKTPDSTSSPQATPTPTPSPSPKLSTAKKSGKVVINEIAWAGTEASATDEWVELYNSENYDINLSGWTLKAEDGTPEIFVEEGKIIKAQSYFLLERTNDTTVNSILSDQLYVGALENEGEFLKLSDFSSTVVDTAGNNGGAWPAGSSTDKISMERISDGGWKNFTGNPSAKDANGNFINGTPKAQNSTPVQVVVSTSGGGGGGGSSSSPDSTSSPQATPTPSPTPSPSPSVTPTPMPTPEPDGDTANLGDVIINEIAWMGTMESRYCEWIEIRNTTGSEINLAGWGIYKDSGNALILSLTGQISPDSYYLIERVTNSCPDPVSDINDDSGSFIGGDLVNTGENLVLKDVAGTIIDQVNGSNEWKINGDDNIIGNNETKETAQKMAGGWVTAVSTPKAQNSENVALKPQAVADLVAGHHSPTITVTWSAPDSNGLNTASLSYDLRYSLTNFPEDNTWDIATKVASSSLPSVGVQGASQSASFDIAYSYGQTIYFALKTKVINIPTCDVGNVDKCSEISNIATVSFPSAIDANAWAMLGKDQYHTSFASNLTGPGVGATTSWEFEAVAMNTVAQPVVSADGDIYFGASDGSSHKLIKLDKNGIKQWENSTNVSIGTPVVLSDETVYFGRIGAGGILSFTALNSDGSDKWDYVGASTVKAITVSSKGEPHFTYKSGAQDKLAVLNTDGSVKTTVSNSGLNGFTPVVLDDGTIITAKRVSGNQFFNAYSADGTQLWAEELFYTGANGSVQSNPSYDSATGKTYSAVGYDGGTSFGFRMFVIPSDGSVLNTTVVDPVSDGSGATMVSITPTSLLVGLDYSWSNPASGSKLFSLNKSNLTINWSFQAEGKINQQIAVDKDGNAYFSTQSGHIYGLDSEGHERWHISTGINSNVSPVLVENGIIWGYGNRLTGIGAE